MLAPTHSLSLALTEPTVYHRVRSQCVEHMTQLDASGAFVLRDCGEMRGDCVGIRGVVVWAQMGVTVWR